MRRASLSAITVFGACLTLFAQSPGGPPPHGFSGHGPMPMGLGMRSGKVITGAPYSADVNTSVTETLSDGNTINRSTTGHVARDTQGRTYFQQNLSGGPWAQNGATSITFLSDPVAGYTYVLNPNTKIAMRRAFRPRTGERPPRPADASPEANERAETDLGQQVINGLPATGKRITHTIPAGQIGNAQPIIDTTEIWTSPNLQVVILSKRSDPRSGRSTYTLNNIQRANPNAALFQVPSDYTVQDAPDPWRHRE